MLCLGFTISCWHCFSTGKIKTSWPSTDFGTFPFCNPNDIVLTSTTEPARRKIGGTWLQKTQQGVISTSTMLEFKTIDEDKYTFQMTAIGRVNIDSMTLTLIQENVNKMSGTAVAAGDEILLHITDGKIQVKSAKTEADLDNEKFKEEHAIVFKQGKIRMKLLNENQMGTINACNITTANNKEMQLGEQIVGTKEDMEFTANISQYKRRLELVSQFANSPKHNNKTVINSEGPAEVGVFFKGTDEVVGIDKPNKPKLIFSGTVFHINKSGNTVVIYHPTNLLKLNMGQKLEIRSRKTGKHAAMVTVERLNYTNAIATFKSGSIDAVDVADLVLGFK